MSEWEGEPQRESWGIDRPCVVSIRGDHSEKFYGPFQTERMAQEWMNQQFDAGHVRNFIVNHLRTPFRERSNEDWWAGDWHQATIVDQEFPKKPWFKVKEGRKLLRNKRATKGSCLVVYGVSHDLDEDDPEYLAEVTELFGDRSTNDRMTPVCNFFPNSRRGRMMLDEFVYALGPGCYRVMVVNNLNYHSLKTGVVEELLQS